jgi:hypothetical protein
VQWGWRSHVTLGIFDSLTNKRFYGVRKENRLTVQFTNNPYTPYVVTGQIVVRDVLCASCFGVFGGVFWTHVFQTFSVVDEATSRP